VSRELRELIFRLVAENPTLGRSGRIMNTASRKLDSQPR
jgi:hypothetical protein